MNAGVACVDVTPPVGVRLSGFAGRVWANDGVRDPLRASALFLEDGEQAALLVALDTIGLTLADDARWRRRLGACLGIRPTAVFLACSHTHSGAATQGIRATGPKEHAWSATVLERIEQAARQAQAERAAVASLRHGEAECLAGVNRRARVGGDGATTIGANPDGPHDRRCRTLALLLASGKPLVTLFSYSCHPVALGNANRKVSADWVGHARAGLEGHSGAPALFLPGCCGDVNPRFMGLRGEDETRRTGEEVAAAARLAWEAAAPAPPSLAMGGAPLAIPLEPPADPANCDRVEAEALEALSLTASPLAQRQLAVAYRDWARATRRRPARAYWRTHVGALRLGPASLVFLPGECFTQIGEGLTAEAPQVWPIAYSRGLPGYLFPDSAFAEGGYEVETAYRLFGEQRCAPGTADAVIAAGRAARMAVRGSCDEPIGVKVP